MLPIYLISNYFYNSSALHILAAVGHEAIFEVLAVPGRLEGVQIEDINPNIIVRHGGYGPHLEATPLNLALQNNHKGIARIIRMNVRRKRARLAVQIEW